MTVTVKSEETKELPVKIGNVWLEAVILSEAENKYPEALVKLQKCIEFALEDKINLPEEFYDLYTRTAARNYLEKAQEACEDERYTTAKIHLRELEGTYSRLDENLRKEVDSLKKNLEGKVD